MSVMLSEKDGDTVIHARAKHRGQQTFTLVEQDVTAVLCITEWIKLNIHTAPPQKLRDALEKCIVMRDFPTKKNAD